MEVFIDPVCHCREHIPAAFSAHPSKSDWCRRLSETGGNDDEGDFTAGVAGAVTVGREGRGGGRDHEGEVQQATRSAGPL